MSFARAIATVGGLTMLSRVAGFARDILTAAVLGAGPVADAFFVALKLPNFFRRLFAEGAFSVSFVPIFSAELERRGQAAAQAFAEEALAVMLTVLLPFVLVMVALMPWLMHGLAPGFADEPAKFALAVDYARMTFPYLLLVSLVALLGGVLNSLERFGPFAAAPIAFNLTLIAALLLARGTGVSAGYAMSQAVTLAGVVQLLWLAASCRAAGVSLRLPRPRLTPRVRRLFVLMAPGAIGTGVMQINLFVDIVLASLLPSGAVSFLYYADRLNQLPLGVIGIAIGTALLPVLSRHVAARDHDAVRHFLSRALEFSLALGLPAAIALVAVAHPIIHVLFERGAFGPEETAATAWALAAYAIGIPAYVIVKVLNAAFFARHDTSAPVRAAIVVAVANAALGLALIGVLGHVGIALATGATAWLNAGLLGWMLHRRGQFDIDARLRGRAPRLLFAGLSMGAALVGAAWALEPWLAGPSVVRATALAALVGVGAAVYFAVAHGIGGMRLGEIGILLKRAPDGSGAA
ncbi:murein biosynthesis integral membrane protein MurJ [Skermanella rosea]|uniref:murein biosynthesis integral membrane protein MurJ n=1 Tax=Skermanella rosea TaxID=1817965 RepID=UPI0019328104|nr:murein biosynthesis integral membrane protein MurJ [Skermanella rosea]UEM03823.1 murein biosynthesis integral membrane protein MurJ [Skermanella rosea]